MAKERRISMFSVSHHDVLGAEFSGSELDYLTPGPWDWEDVNNPMFRGVSAGRKRSCHRRWVPETPLRHVICLVPLILGPMERFVASMEQTLLFLDILCRRDFGSKPSGKSSNLYSRTPRRPLKLGVSKPRENNGLKQRLREMAYVRGRRDLRFT